MAEERQGKEQEKGSGPSDLQEREYRDEQGNIHHHTRTSSAYREGERGGEAEKGKGEKE